MKVPVLTQSYRRIPVTVFWMRPDNSKDGLIYGYQIQDGDLEVWGTGFQSSTASCRAAAKAIDELHQPLSRAHTRTRV